MRQGNTNLRLSDVNTCFVPLVAEQLKGSGVKDVLCVGFPLGAMLTSAKAFEASEAVKAGADEVDMGYQHKRP